MRGIQKMAKIRIKQIKKAGVTGILAASMTMSLFLTGCQSDDQGEGSLSTEMTSEEYAKLSSKMEEGKYYVLHDGDVTEITTVTETSSGDGTIAWFDHNSYGGIATLYKGDKLIYYTTETVEESFTYTRFLDMGYTLPVCGLEAGESGKYHTSTKTDAGTAYPGTAFATTLAAFTTDEIILDKIGGTSLTSENVSDYGTVTGLQEDQEYNVDLYSGSVLTQTSMTANIRVMGQDSDQTYTTNKFDFLSGEVIEINIPNWFNTGYYEINDLGVFRYVSGSSYDETTNFNVLNSIPDSDEGDDSLNEEQELNGTFEITEQGSYKITVSMTFPSDMQDVASEVNGIITAPDGEHYTMYNNGSGQLIFSMDNMITGTYIVGYSHASGMNPTISVERTDQQ